MPIVRRAFVHAVVLVSLSTLAQARGNLKELTVPLKFTPQEGVHESSADLPPTLLNQSVEIRVEDAPPHGFRRRGDSVRGHSGLHVRFSAGDRCHHIGSGKTTPQALSTDGICRVP